MTRNPNDFSEPTKTKILKQCGYMCAKPGCNIQLIGPHSEPGGDGVVNTSEVAHIEGARRTKNNRYNENMTSYQRSHHSNAIALCRTHAKLIDSDEIRFTVDLLHEWKNLHLQLVSLMQSGDYYEDDVYEKPYDKCSSEELRSDQNYRLSLIQEEHRTQNKYVFVGVLIAIAFAILFAVGIWVQGVPLNYAFGVIAILLIFVTLTFAQMLNPENEFVSRQRASIQEANYRLRERGE